ncbi:hypothetical protein [Mesorhizobium erdmanii]|nr:hypothetical protein [Mesorhizobium erdmanii]
MLLSFLLPSIAATRDFNAGRQIPPPRTDRFKTRANLAGWIEEEIL